VDTDPNTRILSEELSSRGFTLPAIEPLAAAVEDLWSQAKAAWPTVAVAPETFWHHIAERLQPDPARELIDVLRSIRAADLYLAVGALQGDPAAVAGFEALLAHQGRALARLLKSADDRDEVVQRARRQLLFGDAQEPKLVEFSGWGSLAGFLRTTCLRLAQMERSCFRRSRARIRSSRTSAGAARRISAGP
jgi:RNA polymerase sigma-70 factor, ECF subfamily